MTRSMTKGSPIKLIVMFTIPLLIGNIFQQFYSMADTLIVGRTIGVNALAAVGSTGSISFLIMGFVNGASMGLAVVAAQRFGAEDYKGLKRSFATGLVISGVITVVITAISVPLTRHILEWMQTPTEIIDDAYSYIVIIFAGTFANMLFNYLSNVIRAMGDSKSPLVFLVIACLLNIVLDYVFILFFHMGVAGAAWATIISQFVSGLLCVYYVHKKLTFMRVSKSDFRMDMDEVVVHLKLSLPMGFQMSIIAIGTVVLQYMLNGLGAVSVAAYTAASKIDQIATQPMNSFGSTMSTFAAQNYGAGKTDRIKKGVKQCLIVSVSFSIVAGIIIILFGHQLAALFIKPIVPQVVSLAQIYLRINGANYIFLAALFVLRFTLQGLGNSVVPTIAGVMELVMRFVAAFFLTGIFGFAGACMANPLAWIGSFIPLLVAYVFTVKKFNRGAAVRN